MMKRNFSYILLYLDGIGYSPAETIARNFPEVRVELGQYRDNKQDGRFIGTIGADNLTKINDCLDALGAFGIELLDDQETTALLERNLPAKSVVSVIDGEIIVTIPEEDIFDGARRNQ